MAVTVIKSAKNSVRVFAKPDGSIWASAVHDGEFLLPQDVTAQCVEAVKRVHAEGAKRDAVVKDPESGEPLGVMVFVPNAGVMKVYEHACALADRWRAEHEDCTDVLFSTFKVDIEDRFQGLVDACQKARGRKPPVREK